MAEEGGIGIIDRGFRAGDIEPQVREVAEGQAHAARRHRATRYTIAPDAPLAEAVAAMRRTGVGTLVVVDEQRRLEGLLTERDMRFVGRRAGDGRRSR